MAAISYVITVVDGGTSAVFAELAARLDDLIAQLDDLNGDQES